MSQNLVAFVAAASGGGVGLLNLDGSGNLKVALQSEVGTLAVGVADGADVTEGAKADAAVSTGATASVIALLKGLQRPLNQSYETVAASQTDQVMGGAGAAGDTFASLLIVPATTSPGAVSIKDGAGSAITVFTGGSTSVADLKPFLVLLNLRSGAGAWKVTTGANVSAIGIGNFT